ncbi:uncharacterized protein LOC113999464 isoform X1 [Pipra filicauda]|uniref:Uncharacterized protein LOC113999464 isoform X1 n=1 Tax=Pipra filicauda TaxID=649802 RepID=A0A6J2IF85_9PASS|nr:uncharacterized protein LOC113999464 isoform X1 [Pipra filicauda]XP_027598718.2 uncharacterized protein LOC113999464 isoform X1 [Pipra filicauda]XP_027598719.2 uncharacterized protein LOC113999464 isoform X1 [Pipra filicauda]XP_027598720.2 uncharacterized protein LOC113999464 isoform X1 [Pipra filicauda]XP_027598721.2 uncharacterized protein LOC113999464 isoform X1 [Pipra filicauda]XP_039244511.1 uncharacterized protein LOC113999464 isoform X1 [Pipra filicauda]XP_039244512.1 uncharacterize
MDWAFLPLGAPRLLLEWVCSDQARSTPSLRDEAAPADPGSGCWLGFPKDAQQPFSSPGRGKVGLSLLSSPLLRAQTAGTGVFHANPPSRLPPTGIWGDKGAAPWKGLLLTSSVRCHNDYFLVVFGRTKSRFYPHITHIPLWKRLDCSPFPAFGCQIIDFSPLFPFQFTSKNLSFSTQKHPLNSTKGNFPPLTSGFAPVWVCSLIHKSSCAAPSKPLSKKITFPGIQPQKGLPASSGSLFWGKSFIPTPPQRRGRGVGRTPGPAAAAAAAAAAAHPILGSQSREKIHIPCGPPSSKSFHVTAELSKTLGKITFTFARVSLAAGVGTATGSPRCSGLVFQQGFGSPRTHSGEMRNIYPIFPPERGLCRAGGLGICCLRLDFLGVFLLGGTRGVCGCVPTGSPSGGGSGMLLPPHPPFQQTPPGDTHPHVGLQDGWDRHLPTWRPQGGVGSPS